MEDLQSRRVEALSAHVEGLEAALAAPDGEASRDSLRRLARSLARAADATDLPDVAARARAAQESPDVDLQESVRALLDSVHAFFGPDEERAGHHVLVVEDDRTVATLILSYLERDGRTLHHAATAAEAEQLLEAHPIDVVILDLILPDRDGRDLLLQIREDPERGTVPVIVLSAHGGAVARAESLAVGASEFIVKPADPKLLRSAVTRHLSEHRRDTDARQDPETGMLSRAGLTEAYRALRSPRGKVEGPLAVAVLAVEPVDLVLQTLGRDEAEALMRIVAESTAHALAEHDEVGRWSEAELLVLMPGTSPAAARDRLTKGLSRLVAKGSLESYVEAGIDVSFAAGVAVADTGADLREAAFAAEHSMQAAERRGESITFESAPGEPAESPRVLLVEDDKVTATLIQHRLVREGFDVMDFLNGEDAFRWASGGSFDVAILDVKVPGMDGFELLERLRAMPRHADAPIIILTGLGGEADVVRGLELGANDYVLKPFSPAELLARVRRLAAEALDARATADTRGDASGARVR